MAELLLYRSTGFAYSELMYQVSILSERQHFLLTKRRYLNAEVYKGDTI